MSSTEVCEYASSGSLFRVRNVWSQVKTARRRWAAFSNPVMRRAAASASAVLSLPPMLLFVGLPARSVGGLRLSPLIWFGRIFSDRFQEQSGPFAPDCSIKLRSSNDNLRLLDGL